MFREIAQLLVGTIKTGAIYSLAALGLVLIHKATGVVNFAHGAFIALGGVFTYALLHEHGVPYALVYVIAPVIVGCIAAAIEACALRPLRSADRIAQTTATIFLGIAITEVIRLFYEADLLAVPSVFAGRTEILGVTITHEALWIGVGALLVSVVAILAFASPAGRGLRALASNPRGAELCGYSTEKLHLIAWFFGGALAGLAGVFAAPALGVTPEIAVTLLVPAFVAAVIGGFDSLTGAVVGALILAFAETFFAFYVSSALQTAASFLLLLAILLVRPHGLFPERRTRSV